MPPKKKSQNHYLPNDKLIELINGHKSGDKSASEKLAAAFYQIAEGVGNRSRFTYTLKQPDDALQEAVLNCWMKLDRYDPSKGRAFNYFTTLCWNSFRQAYRSAGIYQTRFGCHYDESTRRDD